MIQIEVEQSQNMSKEMVEQVLSWSISYLCSAVFKHKSKTCSNRISKWGTVLELNFWNFVREIQNDEIHLIENLYEL